jgi:hypothetical protein
MSGGGSDAPPISYSIVSRATSAHHVRDDNSQSFTRLGISWPRATTRLHRRRGLGCRGHEQTMESWPRFRSSRIEANEESFNPVGIMLLYCDMLSPDRRAAGRVLTNDFNADTGSRG